MTKLFTLVGLTIATLSQAATLAPGESVNINGTAVTCQSSSESRCALDPTPCAYEGQSKVRIGSQALTGCMYLKDAIVQLKDLKDAGACQ